MAERSRRTESTAHPGAIVNNLKQKRRTPEEIARDKLEKEQAKAEKQRVAQEKKASSVRRIAAVQDEIRKDDERARATAARPDLATAQLKRSFAAAGPEMLTSTPGDTDTVMQTAGSTGAYPGNTDHMDDDISDRDPDYQESGDDPASASADDDDDDEFQAQMAAFAENLRKQRAVKGKAPAKPKKGHLRTEIQQKQDNVSASTKRKLTEATEDPQPVKKAKAALGGLRQNWQKEVGVSKLPKKSATSWNRSASRASSTSATSGISQSSAFTSPGPGEFDEEESGTVVQAARAAKGQGARGTAKTTTMGITLKKKVLTLNVDGKVKREAKRKYTNADLPFPAEDFHKDLKHYQENAVPELVDWAGALPDPFAASSYDEFEPTVINIWSKYFGGEGYKPTDAVPYMAGATITNWRSSIGKRGVQVVVNHLNTLPNVEERRKWVAEQLHDLTFLYRDPINQTGSYRSKLFLSVFAAHLRVIFKTESCYGHPIGAAAVTAAALERALSLCKDGALSTEGLRRKGKKSIHSFGAVPWADRAANYLPPIRDLSTQKWVEIFSLAREFIQSSGGGPDDLLDQSTDGESSDPGHKDPRSQVVVSDDEPEEDDDVVPTSPSGSGSGGHTSLDAALGGDGS
ncbi:hypothetical protein C8R47DRAFT_1221011 [Mycena vitilis]|nr:hypothetical protein C8R47DRAFT_1224353 [Mycena vitilis]KAJ6474613.1 hypothetical protein C8R47DRAFT_1221011 [Mycena vitilis]